MSHATDVVAELLHEIRPIEGRTGVSGAQMAKMLTTLGDQDFDLEATLTALYAGDAA